MQVRTGELTFFLLTTQGTSASNHMIRSQLDRTQPMLRAPACWIHAALPVPSMHHSSTMMVLASVPMIKHLTATMQFTRQAPTPSSPITTPTYCPMIKHIMSTCEMKMPTCMFPHSSTPFVWTSPPLSLRPFMFPFFHLFIFHIDSW